MGIEKQYLMDKLRLGPDASQRELLQLQYDRAYREFGLHPAFSLEGLRSLDQMMGIQMQMDALGPERGPGYLLGMEAVGSIRNAFTSVDWGGRRNQQIDKQIEALRRQRMELDGQIEPLTQQELIETRINELYAQRLTYMQQLGSQLKQQLGGLLVRGIFGGAGALLGAAFSGPGGAAAGFNIGFGQNIFGAAEGFHGYVDEPTLFLTGEDGPERVDVTPEGQGGSGETFILNINNPNFTSPEAAMKILRTAAKEIRRTGERVEGITDG